MRGGALLFRLISKLYEKVSIITTINQSFSEWVEVFGNQKMITALFDRQTYHCTSSRPAITATGTNIQPATGRRNKQVKNPTSY